MRRSYLIYNPAAGRYPSRLLTERAADVLRARGWEVCIKVTASGDHVTELAQQAVDEQMDALFVVGGDGSINQSLRPLIGSRTALGVLPAGTANVFAQEIGLPGLTWTRLMALEESAHRLTDAQVWEMDIGLCNGTPFLLWSGVGLDGFIVHRIEPRRRWEKNFAVVQYLTSAVWNATMWQGMNLKVLRNGDQVSGHFLMAVVTNIHLYAGGFAELSPNATLDDGMMDLWLFQGHSMTDIVQRAWDLWAGRHVQSDQVQRIPFREIVLESDSPLYVQLDGEPAKGKQRVEIAVRSQALRVLIPRDSSRELFNRPPVEM